MIRRTLFASLALALSVAVMPSNALAQGRSTASGTSTATTSQRNNPTNSATSKRLASVLQPTRSPVITFRLLFMTGAAQDPKGKEGLANLTAALLSGGGSRQMTYEQITAQFYPMAAGFGAQVDKEMTVFTGTTHVDNLDKYYSIINRMLLDPGFRAEDFQRVKTDQINYLRVSLRESNDEELGKEHLYTMIYKDHPYGHYNVGTISALERLTIDDVREFYRNNYTQANLVLGIAGGYPTTFPAKVKADMAKLPAGAARTAKLDQPKLNAGMKIDIIQRDTRSTAISLGFPINVRRGDKDFAALALVASYFGQHRSSNSYLYQRLREIRGLNYGDYAYIEYFPRGMFQFTPDANLGRQSQIFQIWIRPVEAPNGHFTLRAALYEYDRLVAQGMTKETFDATKQFLVKYANILTATQDAQLGYALDSRYYNTPEFNQYMREQLARLTLEDVNRAIKTHLKSDRMQIALVTKDADALRQAILANTASPITYNSPKTQEIQDEDKAIQTYKINARPGDVRVVPVAQVFQ